MLIKKTFPILGALVFGFFTASHAQAINVNQSGTFSADNQVFEYTFSLPTDQTVAFWTDSYAGGTNVDGTTATAGGFVPVLTLFSSTGSPVANDGASGLGCRGGAQLDPASGMCDDAYILQALTAGSYTLDLTEFPNVAVGNRSDGFLFSSDPNATGTVCGDASGQFLEADVAPCLQRDGNYSVNISSTPEPATFWLALPALALALVIRKRMHMVS